MYSDGTICSNASPSCLLAWHLCKQTAIAHLSLSLRQCPNPLPQVVDARNPLLYFTRELLDYVHTLTPSRQMIVVLNKADLLTASQRAMWGDYLTSQGVMGVFYSARREEGVLNAGVPEEVWDKEVVEEIAAGMPVMPPSPYALLCMH